MLRDMKVDITPTINDVRPPYINLANKSLPMASVPRICERVGAELNAAGSDVYGSKFKIKGKIITKSDRSKKILTQPLPIYYLIIFLQLH